MFILCSDRQFCEVNIRLFVYNILSVQTHNIRNIFWQLVIKTADCFNNIVFILVAKINSKIVCEKMDNNSTLEKVLLMCNRNADLLQLVEATLDSKVASFRRMTKKKFDNSEKFAQKVFAVFCFICFSLLTFELSNINCNMLTERSCDSAVFKVLLNIITICVFIEQ